MKSIEYGAMALADMWFNPPKASTDATVAGIYAGLAATAGVASHNISTPSSSGGGSGGTESKAAETTQPGYSSSDTGQRQATVNVYITESVVGSNPDQVAQAIKNSIDDANNRGVLS